MSDARSYACHIKLQVKPAGINKLETQTLNIFENRNVLHYKL